MANWGRRVNLLTWIAIVFALLSWVIGLSGLAALSRIYQDPSNAEEVKFDLIVITQVLTGSIGRLRPSEKGFRHASRCTGSVFQRQEANICEIQIIKLVSFVMKYRS